MALVDPILNDSLFTATLFALKPSSYVIRLFLAVGAFAGAMNVEKTVTRSMGFVFLLLIGVALLVVGVGNETVGDILLGLGALAAAGYSWWFTRH